MAKNVLCQCCPAATGREVCVPGEGGHRMLLNGAGTTPATELGCLQQSSLVPPRSLHLFGPLFFPPFFNDLLIHPPAFQPHLFTPSALPPFPSGVSLQPISALLTQILAGQDGVTMDTQLWEEPPPPCFLCTPLPLSVLLRHS